MNMQTILYHRLYGIISFTLNQLEPDRIEELFDIFKELDSHDQDDIEELALYHGSPLYSRIRQYRAEMGQL